MHIFKIKQRLHWEFSYTDRILSLASQWLLNIHILEKTTEIRDDLKVKFQSVHCISFSEQERSCWFDQYCHSQYKHTLYSCLYLQIKIHSLLSFAAHLGSICCMCFMLFIALFFFSLAKLIMC